jgi:hypothetical protein
MLQPLNQLFHTFFVCLMLQFGAFFSVVDFTYLVPVTHDHHNRIDHASNTRYHDLASVEWAISCQNLVSKSDAAYEHWGRLQDVDSLTWSWPPARYANFIVLSAQSKFQLEASFAAHQRTW